MDNAQAMHFTQFHFFKRDLQKGPKCYEKMHGLGIIQKVQQYLKWVRIFWRNCSEFFSFQMNGEPNSTGSTLANFKILLIQILNFLDFIK